MSEQSTDADESTAPRWRPLDAIQRRVLGVLIEKAKTTPEGYPLSLNALRTGCNQKSNRSPLMQLEEQQVDEALDELRKFGAVSQVQGGGRVDRYRHLAYEWLGVEKVELAVMAELLLRGAQTVGELRGRATRMEPIKDLGELRPTLDSLEAKRLIIYLTPPGRGSIVSHTLYLDRELEKVRREASAAHPSATADLGGWGRAEGEHPESPAISPHLARPATAEPSSDDIHSLREELAALKRELEATRSELTTVTEELRRDLDQLNRQLGN
jgi:uncharacterized protein YceH (UPF0502 family)